MRRSRRLRELEKKKARKRAIRRRILRIVAVVALVVAADFIYAFAMSGKFYHHTTLNGFDVSGKNVEQVMELLDGSFDQLSLSISEQGTEVLSLNFKDMGYLVDEEKVKSAIREFMDQQSLLVFPPLIMGSNLGMNAVFDVDEAAFQEAVSVDKLSIPRVETENAKLVESNGEYEIIPEIYGNDFEDSVLWDLVKETIDQKLLEDPENIRVEVEIPESLYEAPTVTQTNEKLNETMNLYNKFCKAEITYTFGEETQILGWDTIKGWLTEAGEIDKDQVYSYVYELAAEYDTLYVERTFLTSYGTYVTLPSNDYGFQIDQEAETNQLMEDIYANTSLEREPMYAVEGYSRNGKDDLNGSYVEVNLTAQHLWFYKDGALVVETDVVTGLPTEERETTEGAFAIPYKQSPSNLVGQGGGPGQSWDVEVQYWMPFHDGQGLHDASWRGAFGGTIYMTNGSHGCVNLPPSAAATIYSYMEENMPIILYK